MDREARRFIFHTLQSVNGYIDPPDALVFLSLLRCQAAENLAGAVAEIGVYYGRSYFLLRYICGNDEQIVAIDSFDAAQGQYADFLENGRRLGLTVDEDTVIQSDSTVLTVGDISKKAGAVRFFSVDGGHLLHHVASDSKLAAGCLADHGIIVFDDTFNPTWPEVTVGVADFLRRQEGAFSPFCITKYKTYVCRTPFHDLYSHAIETAADLAVFEQIEIEFLGAKAIRLENPMRRRILHELLVKARLTALSERAYR
ncbi:class I SAM-dependent methyltransferase [Rhizobium grahamii]|uniref:Class I SAM-dependent methyltransferase n=1 Tax=Rhizobium grahamii TaxID=1120045 RepID=A0A5Q0C768_9HYPH|nr:MULTISPECIES: class I SAM-dependent methyltransferase [Rhizobium]QFY61798.1 class I SAM-dependent methyltransferase [Rhizobium grahamii]QRM49029.1 class I SAM-dependent methyltransferase [Rhizobium sp. BG6]